MAFHFLCLQNCPEKCPVLPALLSSLSSSSLLSLEVLSSYPLSSSHLSSVKRSLLLHQKNQTRLRILSIQTESRAPGNSSIPTIRGQLAFSRLLCMLWTRERHCVLLSKTIRTGFLSEGSGARESFPMKQTMGWNMMSALLVFPSKTSC